MPFLSSEFQVSLFNCFFSINRFILNGSFYTIVLKFANKKLCQQFSLISDRIKMCYVIWGIYLFNHLFVAVRGNNGTSFNTFTCKYLLYLVLPHLRFCQIIFDLIDDKGVGTEHLINIVIYFFNVIA